MFSKWCIIRSCRHTTTVPTRPHLRLLHIQSPARISYGFSSYFETSLATRLGAVQLDSPPQHRHICSKEQQLHSHRHTLSLLTLVVAQQSFLLCQQALVSAPVVSLLLRQQCRHHRLVKMRAALRFQRTRHFRNRLIGIHQQLIWLPTKSLSFAKRS